MNRRESSRHGATTGNTYIDPGADTPEGYSISSGSREIARQVIGDRSPEDRIRQRCSISVGDFVMADLLCFEHDPITAGLKALNRGAAIITDIGMVQTGVLKKGHGCEVLCALDFGRDISRETGSTRSSAGIIALEHRIPGSIVIIGNAPSALLAVCDMIEGGKIPALVIGMAVGFVNASYSKERLRSLNIPSISTRGTRGGTPPAVAALNELIAMFIEEKRGN